MGIEATKIERRTAHLNTKFEKRFGFSRALRVDKFVFVSGTTAFEEEGQIITRLDSFEQTKRAIQNIERVLVQVGSSLKNVVRTYVYVGPSTEWRDVGRAHGEFFGEIMPISTFLWNDFFEDPNILVKIEAEAVII